MHLFAAAAGLGSSSSAAFDFRTNGSALPMYAIFAVSLAIFAVGVHRQLRSLGLTVGNGDRPAWPGGRQLTGAACRLFRHAVLQRRLLRRRTTAWAHLPIFWGFVVLALGSLAIMVDVYLLQPLGVVPARGLGYKLFQASLDLFGLAFLVGLGVALFRRVRSRSDDRRGAGLSVVMLLVLLVVGVSGFVLEGLRIGIEGTHEPWAFAGSAVASWIEPVRPSGDGAMRLYAFIWWGHVVVAFGLIAAAPHYPLRHALTAPLHLLFADDRPAAALTTPFDLRELIRSGSFDVSNGAVSIADFSWRARLGLAACTDHGGCRDVCPAHTTGTPLSPMQLVADLRSAAREATHNGECPANLVDGETAEQALWSCTMCGACTDVCPVLVDPLAYVVELRRGLVAANRLGKQRSDVLGNLTRARNPYGSNGVARESLAADLGLPPPGKTGDVELLYWVGCAATYDARARKIAQATVRILKRAGVRCGVLGPGELCCGDPARRIGEEGLFQDLALKNIEALQRGGIRRIVTHCAHCFNALHNEYPAFGGAFDVIHHATLIHELVGAGRIRFPRAEGGPAVSVTLHDACYVGRFNDGIETPRAVLRAIPGSELCEMERSGKRSFCCGAGGGNYWYDVPRREKAGALRIREAESTGARLLVTECPYCLKMLADAGGAAGERQPIEIRDIAEVVDASLETGETT
jgi:Fe-S oxidoreductase/nitrate reductase gamma subunit